MLAIIGGMMAAAYLHGSGMVDLSLGFSRGGLAEGAIMAGSGAAAGYAVLAVFRGLRHVATRARK